jgi:segregation and condensation protein A
MTHKVSIEIYEGPLDLLLHLIKKNDLNVFDIPVAKITGDYLAAVEIMKELALDVAGEFLVMAATLMQIKARMLLPAPNAEGEEGPDPRVDLVNRLVEYQRFKEASRVLEARLVRQKDVHFKASPLFSEGDYTMEASLFELLDAFRDVLKNLKPDVREIVHEEVPIEAKIKDILEFLSARAFATFREILKRETTRRGLIVTFLAILELIRLKQIVARQVEMFGEIRIYRMEALPEEMKGGEASPAAEEEPAPAPSAPLPEDPEQPPQEAAAEENKNGSH